MKQRLSYISILIIFSFCQTFAQSVSVKVPRQVATGENFRLAFVFSTQEVENFRLSQIPDGLEVLAGPYTSRQSSYSIVNGHTSSSSSITYTYTLYAAKAGSYTIPAAHAKADGKDVSSQPTKITVSGQSHARQNNTPRMHGDNSNSMAEAGSKISGSDLFIRVTANKHKVYEQEPIMLTYKVYTLVDLTQLQGKMPDLKGFHTQEITLPQQKSFHVERVNGKNYRCVTWSQYVLFPQMTGKMTIPGITFKGTVVQQNRAVDPFEAFFNGGSGYVEVKKDIVAPAVSVEVMPLPNKPADFSGGVGNFNISASLNKESIKAGDPVTLHVVVSGTGNLKLLKRPEPVIPKDFDKYDPKQSDKTRLTANGVEGSISYDYLIVPRNQGSYTIPPISLVYFDTKTSSYKTVSTKALSLTVEAGDGHRGKVESYNSQTENDIREIILDEQELSEKQISFYGSKAYYAILLTIFVAFVLLLIIFRRRAIDNADVVKMKGKRANKIATKKLRKAANLMQKDESGAFYDEVLRALWGYVGDKLNIAVEQLSRDNISEQLSKRDIDQTTIDSFLSALDECEFERYAPGDTVGNMNKTYTSASEAIMNIEDSLKKMKHKPSVAPTFLLLVTLSLISQYGYADIKSANETYMSGNYQKAISQYEELAKTEESFALYYNLGNAYYRTGNLSKAMLWYHRAHLISPSNSDVRFNIQFTANRTIDKIPPRSEAIFKMWYKSLTALFTADEWALVATIAAALSLILLLTYLFVSTMWLRKVGFFGCIGFVILFLLSNLFGYSQSRSHQSPLQAIIMTPEVDMTKTPTLSAPTVLTIHEGTHVEITDSTKTWREVRLDDNREGWIPASAIEEI